MCLGRRADGIYAATIGGVMLSIPRQVGKTYFVGTMIVVLCILFPGLTVLWTAHRTRTSTRTFQMLQAICKRKAVRPHLKPSRNDGIRTANGEQEIAFRNDSIIMFGARETGFGRGFEEVDVEVFDEAQILGEKALDDMVAATNQSKHPHGALLFYMGTPPKPTDPSEPWLLKRRKALGGQLTTGVYIECSADIEADLDDEGQWAKANPSFPHRTPLESMLRLRENLASDDSWRREALGIYDDDYRPGIFRSGAWGALPRMAAPPPEVLGIAADRLQTTLSLGAYGGGHVGAVTPGSRSSAQMSYEDRQAFCAEVARIAGEQGVPVAVQEKGPAQPLIEDLEDLGVHVIKLKFEDTVLAAADMRDDVDGRRLTTGHYPELETAVEQATWRYIQGRRVIDNFKTDAAMLEAVTYARWVAVGSAYDLLDSVY